MPKSEINCERDVEDENQKREEKQTNQMNPELLENGQCRTEFLFFISISIFVSFFNNLFCSLILIFVESSILHGEIFPLKYFPSFSRNQLLLT